MRPLPLAVVLAQSPREVFSASADPPQGGRQSFEVKNLVGAALRADDVRSGTCEAPRRRGRMRVATAAGHTSHEEFFGLEYRIFLGRLDFSIGTETRSETCRADEGIHTLVAENRSSDSSGVSCRLTSIVIRPE